jgi:hypothetical protein
MTQTRPADLATEAERYLAAVTVFRAEGCEPQWRPEPGHHRIDESVRSRERELLHPISTES